jgi:hypothetical protein
MAGLNMRSLRAVMPSQGRWRTVCICLSIRMRSATRNAFSLARQTFAEGERIWLSLRSSASSGKWAAAQALNVVHHESAVRSQSNSYGRKLCSSLPDI